jgi:hypothetical protein
MATGTIADFKIYDEQVYAGLIEKETQAYEAFNENTLGAILMVNNYTKGNFKYESFFKTMSDGVQRRDPTSTAAVTDKALQQGELISVKLSRRFGPYGQTLDSFLKSGISDTEFSFVIGENIAQQTGKECLNTGLLGARSALSTVGTGGLLHTATSTLTTADLNSALALRGDASQDIILWVMHSKVYFDLLSEQMNNNIDGVTNQNFMTGMPVTLGRNVFFTDSPDLIVAGTPDTYYTLGLSAGAIEIKQTEELKITSELETGHENVFQRIRADYAYNLSLAGMAWDTTSGANPDGTAVGTGSNWLQAATSLKSLAGVIIASD